MVKLNKACASRTNSTNKESTLNGVSSTTGVSKIKKRPIENNFLKIKFHQKRKLLEQSFAKLNAELAQQNQNDVNGLQGDGNIFMDILKIAPIIDLAEAEEEVVQPSIKSFSKTNASEQSVKPAHNNAAEIVLEYGNEEEDVTSNLPVVNSKKAIKRNDNPQISASNKAAEVILEYEKDGSVAANLPIVNNKPRKLFGIPKTIKTTRQNYPLKAVSSSKIQKLDETACSSKSLSDVDLRDGSPAGIKKMQRKIRFRESKQKANQKLKAMFGGGSNSRNNQEKAKADDKSKAEAKTRENPQVNKSDVDLREMLKTEPSTSHQATKETAPNSSTTSKTPTQKTEKKQEVAALSNSFASSKFHTRTRLALRSPPIDIRLQYQLVGLRYFQEIRGVEANGFNSSKFVRVPLSVVSFNVLCQHSMESVPHLYGHLNRDSRAFHGTWQGRQPKLQIEFDRVHSDIFCLQEVQDIHFTEFYRPYFASRNFQGIFVRRTSAATPDGCAIFWKTNKMKLLKSKFVHYNLKLPGMDRDNVGQVAIFGLLGQQNAAAICVSNTHIYFNMKRAEVKLAQIAFLLGEMRQLESQFLASNRNVHFAGHILCGDFNIEPGSSIHSFIMNQRINLCSDKNNLAFKSISGPPNAIKPSMGPVHLPIQLPLRKMLLSNNCELVPKDVSNNPLFVVNNGELTHGFKFASVYEHWNERGEPEVSTYHLDVAQPDFIFYSTSTRFDSPSQGNESILNFLLPKTTGQNSQECAREGFIQLLKRLSLPTRKELDKAGGRLPNEQYGSDHLLIFASFEILCPLSS